MTDGMTPRASGTGWVAIVGGGPGDPELITVRGRRLLAEADVVVVDRLAPRALLAELGPEVEIVDMGKTPYRHGPTQEEIHRVLLDRAGRGLGVVRLKGGDPFVFGRGSEELAVCVAAGIRTEVVPGVTSAIAGPAAIGIPVTQRRVASDFAVVSAHHAPDDGRSTVDWAALAAGPATLVVMMAMERLSAVADVLIANGRPSGTPAAVVQDATLPGQRSVVSTLAEIAAAARAEGLSSPAVVVVGDVVGSGGH